MSNHGIALVVACVVLAVALLLMQAHTVAKDVPTDITPATAPGSEPVPFAPRAAP